MSQILAKPSATRRDRRPLLRKGASAAALTVCFAVAASGAGAHELPVGDGHVTSHPARGNVFSCVTRFNGHGARATGSWFHGKTWDPDGKPHVRGSVNWPQAQFTVTAQGKNLAVRGNGLPVGSPTGEFPVARNDPAYQYDRNPNAIKARKLAFDIPLTPKRAGSPSCVPMGMIGFTTTGVALFNAVDAEGRDAAAHEIQDKCDGHPERSGQYHYHSSSPCVSGANGNRHIGWALDGYPIMGMRDSSGHLFTNADLDACHGRAEKVTVGGHTYDYAYRLTREYPYTIGCFTGKVSQATLNAVSDGKQARGRDGRRGPPPKRGQRPPKRP